MAVPFGLSTTMYITLTDGQSVTILWGWVLVSLISLSIAASLAEICAVYPTAGGGDGEDDGFGDFALGVLHFFAHGGDHAVAC
jgi:amino acid transporter